MQPPPFCSEAELWQRLLLSQDFPVWLALKPLQNTLSLQSLTMDIQFLRQETKSLCMTQGWQDIKCYDVFFLISDQIITSGCYHRAVVAWFLGQVCGVLYLFFPGVIL